MYVQTVEERIKMLRRSLSIHSYIYYVLNDNIISDHQWQANADELVVLQAQYPTLQLSCYDEAFVGWDASTGYHLPKDDFVIRKATLLLEMRARGFPDPQREKIQLVLL